MRYFSPMKRILRRLSRPTLQRLNDYWVASAAWRWKLFFLMYKNEKTADGVPSPGAPWDWHQFQIYQHPLLFMVLRLGPFLSVSIGSKTVLARQKWVQGTGNRDCWGCRSGRIYALLQRDLETSPITPWSMEYTHTCLPLHLFETINWKPNSASKRRLRAGCRWLYVALERLSQRLLVAFTRDSGNEKWFLNRSHTKFMNKMLWLKEVWENLYKLGAFCGNSSRKTWWLIPESCNHCTNQLF